MRRAPRRLAPQCSAVDAVRPSVRPSSAAVVVLGPQCAHDRARRTGPLWQPSRSQMTSSSRLRPAAERRATTAASSSGSSSGSRSGLQREMCSMGAHLAVAQQNRSAPASKPLRATRRPLRLSALPLPLPVSSLVLAPPWPRPPTTGCCATQSAPTCPTRLPPTPAWQVQV